MVIEKRNIMNEKNAKALIQALGDKWNVKQLIPEGHHIEVEVEDKKLVDLVALNQLKEIDSINVSKDKFEIKLIDDSTYFQAALKEVLEAEEEKTNPIANGINRAIKAITDSLSPVVPLMAGAGLGKVVVLVLYLTGVLAKTDPVYIFLSLIFDTAYFFLPAYVGFSAAKIFGANQYFGGFMGLVTVHPTWMQMVADGDPFSFLGMNVPLIDYSTTLVSALLAVWIMSYIEKFFRKIVPDMLKIFAVPLLVILVSTPLTFLIIGPIGDMISNGVAGVSLFLYDNFGLIAIPLLAAVYPWLVSIGIHKALSPISITLVAEQGFDPIIRVVALCANMSQAAASLAVGVKTKNKDLRALAFSSSATAFLGGTTGPAMYGVNLPLKRPMYASMIGAAFGGVFAGLMKMKAFIYVTPALLSLPMWISESENFIVQAVITILIVLVATFIATWLLGFDDTEFKAKQ